jgi:hypothetical protein
MGWRSKFHSWQRLLHLDFNPFSVQLAANAGANRYQISHRHPDAAAPAAALRM